jgi:hypothetical protein
VQYSQHRFTDGAPYVERLASLVGVPLETYGIAGATTDNLQVQGYTGKLGNVPVPSLRDQVHSYIAANNRSSHAASRTLWILSAGAMNIHESAPTETSAVPAVQGLILATRDLKAIGTSIRRSSCPLRILTDRYRCDQVHPSDRTHARNLHSWQHIRRD